MQESGPIFGTNQTSGASFGNTDWWVVRQASRTGEPGAEPARCRLCEVYWKPVFHFTLRCGYAWHDAQDLTQEFFASLLKRNALRTAAQDKGKFRSFLLVLLKRFLADYRDRTRCRKRGGGVAAISLDEGDTEFRQRIEPKNDLDPETICERIWADSVLQNAFVRLEQECVSQGMATVFAELRPLLNGEDGRSYASVGAALNLSEGNVRVIVHRLRRRLRRLLSEAVTKSSASSSDAGDELLGVYASK